jgi:S-adenosylmethionine hydrolase
MLSRTFADVAPGQVVAYVGSSGYLEIAVREGNAARRLGMDIGDPIRLEGSP